MKRFLLRVLLPGVLAAACVCAADATDGQLVKAVKAGNMAQAMKLINATSVNVAEADGTTPLHWAARYDDVELAQKLIAAGAKVGVANRYEITPLYLAAENGSPKMLELLLKSGADPNASVNLGETALMTVARTGVVEAAKVLIDHGAKLDPTEEWHGQTALMWAVDEGHVEMVKFLISRGANVNAVSKVNTWERQVTKEPRDKWLPLGGLTPLLFAARQGCEACAEALIDAGADVNVQDPHQVPATVMAIINGHYDVAALLLERGTNPNLADDTGRTALFSAADFNTMPMSNRPAPQVVEEKHSALDLMKLLIARGANVNAQLTKQQPYRAKLDRGDDTMLSAGTTPLLRAAKAADLPAMQVLIDAGADINLPTRAGITPLMAAAGVGTKEEDSTGRFKTEDEAIEAIGMLMARGADINAADRNGETSLHAAAKWGLDKVVAYLASKGANLNAKMGRAGYTPLDAAMGLAGGSGGFDGSRRDVHESTAKLIEKLGGKHGSEIATAAPATPAEP